MRSRLGELAAVFLKLGVTGFGGPAVHIAMMEDEVVTRRGWLERAHFLDLMAATNLIPGPNSTEMTMHVGYTRARLPGLMVAGASFILPAALITGLIAWFYVRFGSLPQVERLFWGTRPVVITIILGAVWKLGRSAVRNWSLLGIGVAVGAAALAGVNEVVALFAGSLTYPTLVRRNGYATYDQVHSKLITLLFADVSRIRQANLLFASVFSAKAIVLLCVFS